VINFSPLFLGVLNGFIETKLLFFIESSFERYKNATSLVFLIVDILIEMLFLSKRPTKAEDWFPVELFSLIFNFFFFRFSVPEEFLYDPVSKSYGDPSRRPECKVFFWRSSKDLIFDDLKSTH